MTPSLNTAAHGDRLVADTVAVAGDWHGIGMWAKARIVSFGERGVNVILHVGDFGIWPGPAGKKYLMALENTCRKYDILLLVTPGNHEDWARINTKKSEDRGNGVGPVKWLTDHIAVLPRAHRFSIFTTTGQERTFVSLGGAPSVDRHRRTEGRDWWPEEMVTEHDVDLTVAGGYADIMITHDSPGVPYAVSAVEQILGSNPWGWPDSSLEYATVGRDRITRAFEGVTPTLLFHGHYHCSGLRETQVHDRDCTVVALDEQHTIGNTVLLDLNHLEFVD